MTKTIWVVSGEKQHYDGGMPLAAAHTQEAAEAFRDAHQTENGYYYIDGALVKSTTGNQSRLYWENYWITEVEVYNGC